MREDGKNVYLKAFLNLYLLEVWDDSDLLCTEMLVYKMKSDV